MAYTRLVGSPGLSDIYLHDRVGGTSELVSVSVSGGSSFAATQDAAMSDDGRYLAFISKSHNLVAGFSTPDHDFNVFLRDRVLQTTEVVNLNDAGVLGSPAFSPGVTDDGRYVVFSSVSHYFFPGDYADTGDVFVRDRTLGVTELISVAFDGGASVGDASSGHHAISEDGRWVVFHSSAFDVVSSPFSPFGHVYLRDRDNDTTTMVSVTPTGDAAANDSMEAVISADGRYVAFLSHATNLVAGDTNNAVDVFVRDLVAGATTRVSVGPAGQQIDSHAIACEMARDGSHVGFATYTPLVPEDVNLNEDVYVRDLDTGELSLTSVNSFGVVSDGGAIDPGNGRIAISNSGLVVAFDSVSTNLAPYDANQEVDVFARDTVYAAPAATYCTAKLNSLGCLPRIDASGITSANALDALRITAISVRNQKQGLFFWGTSAAAIPFAGGILCVKAPVTRTSVQNSGGASVGSDCSGSFSFHFGQAYVAAEGVPIAVPLHGQYWSRDPGFEPPNNVSFTDAISFVIVP